MNNDRKNTPDNPEEGVQGPLSPDDVARQLASFGAFLRETGNEVSAMDVDYAAQTARMAIDSDEAEQVLEGDENLNTLPSWANEVPNSKKVFVEKRDQEISPDFWEPVVEKTGRQSDAKLEVRFKRLADVLTPGGTVQEQGIPLEPIDNYFTVDEWQYIAKPIFEKLLKTVELRKLSSLPKEEVTNVRGRIKNVVSDVFPGSFTDIELKKFEVGDIVAKDFARRVRNLTNSVTTDPKVLKDWIKSILEEREPETVEERQIPEKGTGKLFVKQYHGLQKKEGIKRLKGMFLKKSESEDEMEDFINKMADKISRLGEQLLYLNTKYDKGIYKVPEVKGDYVETPYVQRLLAELTRKVAHQLEKKKGMVSIVGDMGTGKNYIVEHFAAKTNRPFFYFPCSRGMDAADLGFHFEYRKGESIVVPSALAKGLQTKNAVILIDEPNALPPEVIAALHGLADHNRAFVYNGVSFKAAEGVVIIMTMNPATYAHVKNLPEAFSDRTLGQDMYMDYPPLTKLDEVAQEQGADKQQREDLLQEDNSLDKIFVCDEAMILKNEFPSLKKYSPDQFTKLWEVIINGASSETVVDFEPNFDGLKPDFEAILKILKVCDNWRKKYKNEDMYRTISLRGAIAVCEKYQEVKDVKKAFLDLYKANSLKYDGGPEDYSNLQQVLNDTAELEKSLNEILAS